MLRPGQQIGSYRILSTLGSGGMGEVYRAHDATLGRDVAIKVLPPAFTSDPDRLNRFEREARILASLNHPNIATIHGVEREIGIDALVLEVVEGETLAERLERETSRSGIPVPEAVNIARQIAEALEAAHEKGIVHRDLKPANVKIRPDGVVKVLDFGLAKAVEADVYKGDISKAPTMTISRQTEGILVGTVAYMSPEQAAGKPVDRRADIWAFGVLLFEMVTGRRLFAGDSVQELLVAILTREPSLDGVATGVRAIVERCLRRDPRRRWQSIGDVRLALEEGLIEVPSRPAVPASSRLPWVLVAVLLLALSTGALLRIREAPARRTSVHFAVPVPGGDSSTVNFAVSPDGRSLAIAATREGRRQLYVRAIDSVAARPIPDTEGADYPFWSADSLQIGFFADKSLKRVAAAGGRVVTITATTGSLGGTWNAAGSILFVQGSALQVVDHAGGVPMPVLRPDLAAPSNPQFLPGGRRFLYTQTGDDPTSEHQGVYVGSLDGAPSVRLIGERVKALYVPAVSGRGPGHLVFRRGGLLMAQPFDPDTLTLSRTAVPVTTEPAISMTGWGPTVLFTASDTGLLAYQPPTLEQLAWVDRSGVVRETVGPPGEYRSFRLSPDGGSVAMSVSYYGDGPSVADVARLDLRRGTLERLTVDGEADLIPVWSPDSARIAFGSHRLGNWNPYVTPVDGGPNQETLLADMVHPGGWPNDWSPDGNYVLWQGGDGLWLVPATGRGEPLQYLTERFNPRFGQFSPNGHWIAYSATESGREEVYVQSFPAGRRFTVSAGGGAAPAWRKDGSELFYVAADGMLTAVPVTLKETSIDFGSPRRLFPARFDFNRAYEVSDDGQRFLVAQPAIPGDAAITVVLNWQTLLER
jgi:serine/threonine protein kinase/Tol biopolymer transport system component